MGFRFNIARLEFVVRRRFPGKKSILRLQDEWEKKYKKAPGTATLNRWRKGALPQSSVDLWKLSAILQVDPMALIEMETLTHSEIDLMVRTFQLGQWGRYPSLSFLKDFLGRQAVWPPVEHLTLFGPEKKWCIHEFYHDATLKKNFYQKISLALINELSDVSVAVFHVAYRQDFYFAGRWLQFGYIVRMPDAVSLFHISGDSQVYTTQDGEEVTRFETFFGPESVTFRVASIHEFTLALIESDCSGLEAVRFR